MMIDPKTIVSVSEAGRDFFRVTRIADKHGHAVIFKDNRPKYLLIDIDSDQFRKLTDDEKIDVVAVRIMERYRPAFLELAK